MIIPYFEVLAFTKRLFAGNPAAICLLEEKWLPDDVMQKIAAENNLAATAFLLERHKYFEVRWFSPVVELDLCGHATLASGHVIFHHLNREGNSAHFQSRSDELRVNRTSAQLILDFPSRPPAPCKPPKRLEKALGTQPKAVLKGRDYFAVFESESEVAAIHPDFNVLAQLDARGVIVTAPGDSCNFVSRYFAPAMGIPEDAVTGSAHCALIPYWSKQVGKTQLRARQLSKRGGDLFCEDRGERVGIGGNAVTYVEGKIHLNV